MHLSCLDRHSCPSLINLPTSLYLAASLELVARASPGNCQSRAGRSGINPDLVSKTYVDAADLQAAQ